MIVKPDTMQLRLDDVIVDTMQVLPSENVTDT